MIISVNKPNHTAISGSRSALLIFTLIKVSILEPLNKCVSLLKINSHQRMPLARCPTTNLIGARLISILLTIIYLTTLNLEEYISIFFNCFFGNDKKSHISQFYFEK